MVATVGGLCSNWTTVEAVAAIQRYSQLEESLLQMLVPVASEIMFMLSGQQWPGECTDTVRPCCGHTFDRCDCSCVSVLDIGVYPVISVQEIKIDGDPFSDFNGPWDFRYIRRTDGLGWPSCQDLRLPDTEPNTWSVRLTYGFGPPAGGVLAATILAGELAFAVNDDEDNCRLPRSLVSSIVRQGVTVAFRNSETSLSHGFTGIQEIDLWLATIPEGLRKVGGAQVFVPEFHKKSTKQT